MRLSVTLLAFDGCMSVSFRLQPFVWQNCSCWVGLAGASLFHFVRSHLSGGGGFALFIPHNSGCPIPEGELDDWRLTIINRQGQEQEQLQENPTQLSKQELQRRLEGDNWTGETRFRRKITPTRRATSKTTPTRQSSQPQRLMDTPPTRSKIQLRAPQKIWRPKAAPSTNLDTTQPKETIHRPLTAQEDNQDCWERQGEYWIRHHTTLRTTLFTPTDGPGHPPSQNYNHPQQLWRSFTTQR